MDLLDKAQAALLSRRGMQGLQFFSWATESRGHGNKDYPAPYLSWPMPPIDRAATEDDLCRSGSWSLQALLTTLVRISYPGVFNKHHNLSEMTVERIMGSCIQIAFYAKETEIALYVLQCLLPVVPC